MPYFSHDDIAQIATPPGPGLIGAIRLSGDRAWEILARATTGLEDWFADPNKVRAVRDCRFLLPLKRPGETVRRSSAPPLGCPARVFLLPAPASYTRENMAEVQLPGAAVLLTAGLEALVAAGARAAAPGEFTFRAFRNGRIGLGQAEAVEEVIAAADATARRRALAKLGGEGRELLFRWRERLLDIAARVEAELDFSEDELDGKLAADLQALVEELAESGVALTGTGGARDGALPRLALLGLANAGKSSLLNRLLGRQAALVSEEASTTRDALPHEVEWDGARLVLIDNPGFDGGTGGGGGRAAARGFKGMGGEEAVCWVIDASREFGADAAEFLAALGGRPGRFLLALNKADLPERITPERAAEFARERGFSPDWCGRVSAATAEGVDAFRSAVTALIKNEERRCALAEAEGWNVRERTELAGALSECRMAARVMTDGGGIELAAENLRQAAAAFSRSLGEGYGEEVLTRIFSAFCLGK